MDPEYEAWRDERRRRFFRNLPWIVPTILVVGTALFYGFGQLFVWLWRQTVVDIFGWKPITFWQGWGLILLAQFLFKANMQPVTRTGRWRGGWRRPSAAPGEPGRV